MSENGCFKQRGNMFKDLDVVCVLPMKAGASVMTKRGVGGTSEVFCPT